MTIGGKDDNPPIYTFVFIYKYKIRFMSTDDKIAKIIIVGLIVGLCYLTYQLYKLEQKLNELEQTECNIE
jgi:hypothetical protein